MMMTAEMLYTMKKKVAPRKTFVQYTSALVALSRGRALEVNLDVFIAMSPISTRAGIGTSMAARQMGQT
tara:strand:+ start:88 stop:294 length:207 start_codon:yes stop_codon:yes gene_type:complete